MEATSAKPVDLEYKHFLMKARDAKVGGVEAWRPQSTGEKVAVALALNRADWLKEIGYTIPEAIERAGNWVRYIRQIERELEQED
jgi:hypothetical protein